MVVKAEADFGITSLDYIPNNIRVDFLFRTRLVLIAPHGWPFTRNEHGYIGDLAELEGMPFLMYSQGGNVKRYIERYIQGREYTRGHAFSSITITTSGRLYVPAWAVPLWKTLKGTTAAGMISIAFPMITPPATIISSEAGESICLRSPWHSYETYCSRKALTADPWKRSRRRSPG